MCQSNIGSPVINTTFPPEKFLIDIVQVLKSSPQTLADAAYVWEYPDNAVFRFYDRNGEKYKGLSASKSIIDYVRSSAATFGTSLKIKSNGPGRSPQ